MTERVSLELIAPHHADEVQGLASHPDIVATTNLPDPYPESGAERWIEDVVPRQEAGEEYAFAILNEDAALVGVVGLADVKGEWAELGFWIGKPYWNRGYATEAVRKTLRFAFQELDLQRVLARPLERNGPSRRVVEKSGFELRRVETHENPKWRPTDKVACYEINRCDWNKTT
jgi:RimJ/RimL family protein N-acetyltransferase